MAVESYVKPELNLAVFVHTVNVPDDDFLSFYESFFQGDSFKPPMNLLVDLRETSSISRSPEALLRFSQFVETQLADIADSMKVAVVAPKDLSFGLARMYEILSDSVHWNFVVFRAMDAALAWLGMPEDLALS